MPLLDPAALDPLFRPRSVAVVGASSDPSRIGGAPLHYLQTFGFPGRIHPVHPRDAEVQGLRAYRRLTEIPGGAELAIVAVPARAVAGVIADAAEAGTRAVVLFSAGFAEIGADGAAAQTEVASIAARAGIRLLGPNCLGVMNFPHRLHATFSPAVAPGLPPPGGIGLVSQSGAFGGFSFALARDRGIGFSAWVTTGNEAGVDFADCLAWLVHDPATKVVLGYMEGCRDGPKLVEALRLARDAGKPVVMVKVGRSEEGAAAAASHTASLTGADAVYDGVFRQYGVHRAQSVEEFFDIGYAASVGRMPAGRRIGLLTVSGGVGALMADAAAGGGLDVPALPETTQTAIRDVVAFAGTRNPVDVTGQVGNDPAAFDAILDHMLAAGGLDSLVYFASASGQGAAGADRLVAMAEWLRDRHPGILPAVVSLFREGVRARLDASGCLSFDDPSRAIRAIAAMTRFASAARTADVASPAPIRIPPGAATEPASLALLREAGVPTVAATGATNADAAVAAASAIGRPVALKIVSPDITHKTEAGGVRLGVAGADAVRAAFDGITAAARRHAPAARIEGVLVAPMERGGVECILGVQRDPVFGAMVMFGLGGIHVEALRDVSFRLAPFDAAEAHRMIREIRAFPILTGLRGAPPADLDALAAALAALSRLAAAAGDSLETLDVNPFLVRPDGAIALDAVVIGRESDP